LKVSDIVAAAELRTGIPLAQTDINERERLDMLEETLKKKIIGQDGAISLLCKAVKLSRSGIRHGGRPNASFLFIGKSGVGKTECAKALASAVFKSEKAFIRLDMSEFSEPHSVSKLIGSPPGYVGFGERNSLAERVKRSPYSLVLFDEIEKAHRDVHSLLLQILDDGRLTDSAGQTVRFDNTIIIMTANGGKGVGGIGFGAEAPKSAVTEAAKLLAPEIVDRVDETVYFKPLTRDELCEVASRSLLGFAEQMNKAGYTLELGEGLAEKIVEISASTSARTVSRCAVRLAEEAVSPLILNETLADGEKLTIFIENGAPIAKINQNSY
jgi:ATP-dependent Clp protease ATP-binding subunit ClpC